MLQIVTVFRGFAEASDTLSGVANTWHAANNYINRKAFLGSQYS